MTGNSHELLRHDINISLLRSRFERRGIVEVHNALSVRWAAALHRFLDRDMPADWWTIAIQANREPEHYRDVRENDERIADAQRRARRELRAGQFCYYFYRTFDDHNQACECVECRFRAALAGNEMIDFFAQIGLNVQAPREMFASRYSPGCFLAPHHDRGNGRIGFVLNLSRGWRPQWGGLLIFLNDDWSSVRRVCAPEFNTLCLFALPPDRTVPHLVTQVVVGHRLAFTGWYGLK